MDKNNEINLRTAARTLYDNGMHCNCDLDRWQPEPSTGHSHVCRIHKAAMAAKYRPNDLAPETLAMLRAREQ